MKSPDANHAEGSLPSQCGIAPWLEVWDGAVAVNFYESAFGAEELYRLDGPDGSLISRLRVQGAEFWLSSDAAHQARKAIVPPTGGSIRMIFTTPDPDILFHRALQAGATLVNSMAEANGWRIGRLADPYGHHWEIGCQLTTGMD